MFMIRTSLLKILFLLLLCVVSLSLQAQKIGLLMDSYIIDRWYLDQKLFIDKVKTLGGEVQVEVAYGDALEQLRLAKKLIADGAKVLVVIPVDGQKSAEIVKIAKAANVPVISYDRLILSSDVSIYVSYNNVRVGELQAQYAVSKAPTGNYLLVSGPDTDNNALLFKKGQLNVLQPLVDKGKIKLIGQLTMEDWGEIGSLMKVDEFLYEKKEKPVAIIASNDALASGAIQALSADLKGKVIVTGQDADLTAIRFIIAGSQSMTIYKPIKPLAQLAAETAMKLSKGEPITGKTKMKSGDIEVEAILLDPVSVDKTNYKETVVKDGHVSLSELMDKK
jgi:D-xylose transport system substrate-binding protein